MNATVGFKKVVARIRRAWRDGERRRAFDEVNRALEIHPDNPKLLIMRAALLLLQDDDEDLPPLNASKEDLEHALEFDDESIDALIDLGHFVSVHEDDAREAAKHFDKAVHLSVDMLTRALVGLAEAQFELEQNVKASHSLMLASQLALQYRGTIKEYVWERIKDMLKNTIAAPSNGTHH